MKTRSELKLELNRALRDEHEAQVRVTTLRNTLKTLSTQPDLRKLFAAVRAGQVSTTYTCKTLLPTPWDRCDAAPVRGSGGRMTHLTPDDVQFFLESRANGPERFFEDESDGTMSLIMDAYRRRWQESLGIPLTLRGKQVDAWLNQNSDEDEE